MIKKTLYLAKWVIIVIVVVLLLVFLLLSLDSDARSVVLNDSERELMKTEVMYSWDGDSSIYFSFLEKYGQNKILADGFEIQCLFALSHYPELIETPIEFRVQPAFLPLASRPDPVSILFPWINRKYLVIISNESADFFEPILLKNTPFNEQVGIIGHELAHSVYYQNKNSLHLAHLAYRYQDNEFITEFERETDKVAIAHGLGYQLYDFAFFVRKAFGNSKEEILNENGGTYLSPNEIAFEMKDYVFYKDTLAHPDTYFPEK